jgi:hypothetical protein
VCSFDMSRFPIPDAIDDPLLLRDENKKPLTLENVSFMDKTGWYFYVDLTKKEPEEHDL